MQPSAGARSRQIKAAGVRGEITISIRADEQVGQQPRLSRHDTNDTGETT